MNCDRCNDTGCVRPKKSLFVVDPEAGTFCDCETGERAWNEVGRIIAGIDDAPTPENPPRQTWKPL